MRADRRRGAAVSRGGRGAQSRQRLASPPGRLRYGAGQCCNKPRRRCPRRSGRLPPAPRSRARRGARALRHQEARADAGAVARARAARRRGALAGAGRRSQGCLHVRRAGAVRPAISGRPRPSLPFILPHHTATQERICCLSEGGRRVKDGWQQRRRSKFHLAASPAARGRKPCVCDISSSRTQFERRALLCIYTYNPVDGRAYQTPQTSFATLLHVITPYDTDDLHNTNKTPARRCARRRPPPPLFQVTAGLHRARQPHLLSPPLFVDPAAACVLLPSSVPSVCVRAASPRACACAAPSAPPILPITSPFSPSARVMNHEPCLVILPGV